MSDLSVCGIVVAAGEGVRMKNTIRKQYLSLGGRPVLGHTLLAVDACPIIDSTILVVPEEDMTYCRESILSHLGLRKKVALVAGGTLRQDSVYNGLLEAEGSAGIVVIHDGVRPLVPPEAFSACIETAKSAGACIVGIPVSDTVKQVGPSGQIERTLDRSPLWLAQTPQAFQYEMIRHAHEEARQMNFTGTDDALLVERMGSPVRIIPGSRFNIKITTPEDLRVAEALIANRILPGSIEPA